MQQQPSNFYTSHFYQKVHPINKNVLQQSKYSSSLNNEIPLQPSPQTTIDKSEEIIKLPPKQIIKFRFQTKTQVIQQQKHQSIEIQTDTSWFQKEKIDKECQTIQYFWKNELNQQIKLDVSENKKQKLKNQLYIDNHTAIKLIQMQKMRQECIFAINNFDKLRQDKEDLLIN